MIRRVAAFLILLLAGFSLYRVEAEPRRSPPYWASISAGQAMMRAGPGQNYPGLWLYVRRDLPIRVVEIYRNWRKIQDPDGTTGWMLVNLLSDQRTALVRGDRTRPMHAEPTEASLIRYRAEPGVVGRISRCSGGWCRLDVGGRAGFIRTDHIWGAGPSEVID